MKKKMYFYVAVVCGLLLSGLLYSFMLKSNNYDNSFSFVLQKDISLDAYSTKIGEYAKKADILKNVDNIGNYSFTYDAILEKNFIQGEGITAEGNRVIFRFPISIGEQSNGDQLIVIDNPGESCTGVNCSHCVFAEGGGCACNRGGGGEGTPYCNHSTEEVEDP